MALGSPPQFKSYTTLLCQVFRAPGVAENDSTRYCPSQPTRLHILRTGSWLCQAKLKGRDQTSAVAAEQFLPFPIRRLRGCRPNISLFLQIIGAPICWDFDVRSANLQILAMWHRQSISSGISPCLPPISKPSKTRLLVDRRIPTFRRWVVSADLPNNS